MVYIHVCDHNFVYFRQVYAIARLLASNLRWPDLLTNWRSEVREFFFVCVLPSSFQDRVWPQRVHFDQDLFHHGIEFKFFQMIHHLTELINHLSFIFLSKDSI